MKEILNVQNLSYYYKDGDHLRYIFKNADISFEEGHFYAILGESGCGKTTFLSIIAGMDQRYQGEVYYNKKEIKDIGLDQYRRSIVSMVYQNYNLIHHLTAVENCMVAIDISNNVEKIDKEEIIETLHSFGIGKDKQNRKVSKLSGGEQQRVAVARAILTKAPIIIADEPTGNLDHESAQIIIHSFLELAHQQNKCVIMVTHNELLSELADTVIRINSKTKNFAY